MSTEEQHSHLKATLENLCISIRGFIDQDVDRAVYKAPIIDHHHPDDYQQRAITGLKKFLGHAEAERDYVSGLLNSEIPVNDLSTNAPHLLAVWDEFRYAEWPIVCISQLLDCGTEGQAKIDVVAKGGDEWIKVNTIKEARLMAEFREQDSYIDSDYDTDPSTGPNQNPCARPSTPPLSNSIIAHVELLVRAAQAYPRPRGFRPPRVKYVLNRLQECPEGGHQDVRIPVTFSAVKELGASLVLGARQGPLPERKELIEAVPTARILLDLSVVVALCCESTHMALPTTNQELEARFRPLQLSADGTLELAPHTNVSKDLSDQLDWESRHPLILEIQQRLSAALGEDGGPLEFWVTKEVKDRLPAIVDLIGGDIEKARAKALFDGEGFWDGSRWSGRARILRDIRARVLDNERGEARDSALTSFQRGLVTVCQTMLDLVEPASNSGTPPRAASPPAIPAKVRRSKNPKRSITIFPGSRLPSSHTLRTLTAGVQNGMTVLTNNRGAISKVIREMGVTEGLPRDPIEDGKAVVWIVNPSSLSEWRRGDVEQQNRALKESLTQVAQQDRT